jgi:hypothetical protein
MVDAKDEPSDPTIAPPILAVATVMRVSTRAHTFLPDIPKKKIEFATSLVMGERTVEIPGRCIPLEAASRHEPIVLSHLRTIYDYTTAPCKHECAVLKQSRPVRLTDEVWRDGTVMRRDVISSGAVWHRYCQDNKQ